MELSRTQLMDVVNRIKMVAYLVRQLPDIPENVAPGNRVEPWQYADSLGVHGVSFSPKSNGADLFWWLQKESGLEPTHLFLVGQLSDQQYDTCIDAMEKTAHQCRDGVEWDSTLGAWVRCNK